jgi:hypothetical protein
MGRSGISLLFGAAALLAASACGDGESATNPATLPDGRDTDGTGDDGVPGDDGAGSGSGGEVPGDDGGGPGGGGSDGVVDPTGVWWTEIETTGSQDLPTVGLLEGSKIRFVMRVVIEGTVPNQTAKFEFCQLQTEWENPLIPGDFHTIGFRPEAAAAFDETLSVDFSGLSVGSAVPVPDLTFIGGGDATGAILDEDGDGYPAITAWVRVILPFEVAEVITINAKLDVEASDEDTLSGTLDFDVEADILDSSSAVFVPKGFLVSIVPDSNAVPITVRRIPGGGDCSAIPSTIAFSEVPPPGVPPTDPLLGPQPTP